jgi:hypothetical protein
MSMKIIGLHSKRAGGSVASGHRFVPVQASTMASPGGDSKILNIENEGGSHDVVENKGRNFISHDVYDK